MLTYIGVIIVILSFFSFTQVYKLLFRTRLFDKYFQINLEESYNLDDLFPIKIKGQITPKVDYLDIPYESLNIPINTKTICGTIENNLVSLELIKSSDRKKSLNLIKQQYTKTVRSYISETIKTKKEYIELIKISKRQKHHLKKIACANCKHQIQCEIMFDTCNYQKKTRETLLLHCNKGKYDLNL
ncbi:hypothetical protein [Candidatus Formimonas warabiya]|uniref:Uncharacterized protein n=1 Tax=Formimonas warabiya TaxID=1761012 RepID=A0A3G1KWL4_FORW1|nr:hypothetical protein [Candidatus Formimonas warabiya]ATW26787.1 hypothetical protein DCMF_20255 [Candidatus Formimonas warabiya]